jgi:hypothetical protein
LTHVFLIPFTERAKPSIAGADIGESPAAARVEHNFLPDLFFLNGVLTNVALSTFRIPNNYLLFFISLFHRSVDGARGGEMSWCPEPRILESCSGGVVPSSWQGRILDDLEAVMRTSVGGGGGRPVMLLAGGGGTTASPSLMAVTKAGCMSKEELGFSMTEARAVFPKPSLCLSEKFKETSFGAD